MRPFSHVNARLHQSNAIVLTWLEALSQDAFKGIADRQPRSKNRPPGGGHEKGSLAPLPDAT